MLVVFYYWVWADRAFARVGEEWPRNCVQWHDAPEMHLIFLKAQYMCNFLQLVRPSSILFPTVVVLVFPTVVVLVFPNLFHKGWLSSLFYLLLLPFLFNVCLLFPFYCFLLVWLIDCLVFALLRVSYCPYYPLLFMSQCPVSSWFKYRLLSVVELTFCFLGGFIFMTKW